jgi:hypothetical protein
MVRAVVQGKDVTREEILAWEAKRFPKAARRIGLPRPDGDLATQRLTFADDKITLGAAEIRRRLAGQLRLSDLGTRAATALTRGRRVSSVCDLYVTGGDAAAFVDWFTDDSRPDYVRSMIAANPDHFLIATAPDGRQEVIETTGGSPLPTRFLVDYQDHSTLRTPLDPTYSVSASGVAQAPDGTAIGGVRHQFRDIEGGFHAHLLVEFPTLVSPHMVGQHRWHLAAEFANWIEFAFIS